MQSKLLFLLPILLLARSASATPEVIEIGPKTFDLLPGGKEADGIVGDFLMRNDLIEAVISCDAPRRKANMGAYWTTVSPGCVYDLTLRGEDNDQITVFSPCGQKGQVSYVRPVASSTEQAALEVVVSSANNGGLAIRHEYRLRDGDRGLLVVTSVRNESDKALPFATPDSWIRLSGTHPVGSITVGDSNDPAARVGYAYGWLEGEGWIVPPQNLELAPGEESAFSRFLAIGQSPAEAYGVVAKKQFAVGTLVGKVVDPEGNPVPEAEVEIVTDEGTLTAYPMLDGTFRVDLPIGARELTAAAPGRGSARETVVLYEGQEIPATLQLKSLSAIRFDIRDEEGNSLPCKAQFHGLKDTPNPNLGPRDRAHGCVDQYHSETGEFQVALDPGTYTIRVTHGIEYSLLERTVLLVEGEILEVTGTLKRLVDTAGWVSTDFHNHSTPSGDNVCGTADRIINLAAEHIEFAPTTEHNRLFDWTPTIESLGLSERISTLPGIELTGSGAHFNAFPYVPDPTLQDGGAPEWQKDPRLNAIVLRDFQGEMPERWVQLNHPDMVEDFIDWNNDGFEDGGYLGLGNLIDGAECWNEEILEGAPYRIKKGLGGKEEVQYNRSFIWLQMLNRGARYICVCVSDAHSVHGNGVGGWRMYVPSSSDRPAEIDWKEIVRNTKAGRAIMTTGPFLEVETEDGILPGGSAVADGSIALKVKVQCTDWVDINRIQVLVNGRQRQDVNFTRESHPDWFGEGIVKFDRTLEVPLSQDSHLIVVAAGEGLSLEKGYGTSEQGGWEPLAFHNPIYVDVDGGGFMPNGDSLDFPLPVKKMDVEEVRKRLASR
jgi:hypothetical protein